MAYMDDLQMQFAPWGRNPEPVRHKEYVIFSKLSFAPGGRHSLSSKAVS